MKKIVGVVLLALFLVAPAYAGIIGIVPTDTPDWVTGALDGQRYFIKGGFAHGIGVTPKMKNLSLQRRSAETRARAMLTKKLGIVDGVLRGSEICGHWEDTVTGEMYALARVKIAVAPAK